MLVVGCCVVVVVVVVVFSCCPLFTPTKGSTQRTRRREAQSFAGTLSIRRPRVCCFRRDRQDRPPVSLHDGTDGFLVLELVHGTSSSSSSPFSSSCVVYARRSRAMGDTMPTVPSQSTGQSVAEQTHPHVQRKGNGWMGWAWGGVEPLALTPNP